MMIKKLKMKITTKSKIVNVELEIKYSSEQKIEDNFRQPVFWQTPYCTHTLPVGLCQTKVSCLPELKDCCLCVGTRQALLQGWHLSFGFLCPVPPLAGCLTWCVGSLTIQCILYL